MTETSVQLNMRPLWRRVLLLPQTFFRHLRIAGNVSLLERVRVAWSLAAVTGQSVRLRHWQTGHEWKFVRNIYGDEINYSGGMRSIYRCHCGKVKFAESLHDD